MNLNADLTWIPIETPDAKFRIKAFIRLLAMNIVEQKLVEAGQDSRENPVDLPLVSDKAPSQVDPTKVLDV